MKIEYLVPDYYPEFSCKMGTCRSACCEGWPVSFSMTDYFTLLGVECSAELRRKLDIGMRLADYPTPEAYAQISKRYDGQCPMRLEDGRCAIHAELGEELLPTVCRLYPRGMRLGEVNECSCANSCEAVLELLLGRKEPMSFRKMVLGTKPPAVGKRKTAFETLGMEMEIRQWLISLIQDRERALCMRIIRMGQGLLAMEAALESKDAELVRALISGEEKLPDMEKQTPEEGQLPEGLKAAAGIIKTLDERSDSIRMYGEAALAYFGNEGNVPERYNAARRKFEEAVPEWEIWFEHMLVNHMFFAQFPFQDRPVALRDEFLSLCAVYVVLRFLLLGWMVEHDGEEQMIDVAAAAFRLIDHTGFDRYAGPLLERMGCADREKLKCILFL